MGVPTKEQAGASILALCRFVAGRGANLLITTPSITCEDGKSIDCYVLTAVGDTAELIRRAVAEKLGPERVSTTAPSTNGSPADAATPLLVGALARWQAETIGHVVAMTSDNREIPELRKKTDEAIEQVTQSVLGNRPSGTIITRELMRSLVEATMLWCLRRCGRPEVMAGPA